MSDYNKGLFHTDVHRWIRQDCITIVDPKKGPISKWRGCTVFKPNFKEACELSGHTDPEDQCNYFYNELDCTAVVVTHGGKGVYGSVLGRFFEFVPKDKVSVASVIGAGDCFISFLAMALAHNVDIIDAIEIAYEAGAKYIQKGYNAPVSPSEFISGIVLPELLANRNYRLAFTNGCFDGGLTRGHIECLKFAKQQGDKLVVAINSDESVKRIKGEGRPFLPLMDRMEIIDINGYSLEEKIEIAKKYLVPKQRAAHGLSTKQFKIKDSALESIIEQYTRESGVRGLDKKIASLARFTAKSVASNEEFKNNLDTEEVERILGPEKIEPELYENNQVQQVHP